MKLTLLILSHKFCPSTPGLKIAKKEFFFNFSNRREGVRYLPPPGSKIDFHRFIWKFKNRPWKNIFPISNPLNSSFQEWTLIKNSYLSVGFQSYIFSSLWNKNRRKKYLKKFPGIWVELYKYFSQSFQQQRAKQRRILSALSIFEFLTLKLCIESVLKTFLD